MFNKIKNRASCKIYYEKNKQNILEKKKNRHPSLNCYKGMIQRCTNKNRDDYKYYGGLGITVCKEWLVSFEQFNADMGNRPSPEHTLDRIDGTKGYSKENCRWATKKEQSANLKSNRNINYNGKTMNLSQWARELNMPVSTLGIKLKKKTLAEIIKN